MCICLCYVKMKVFTTILANSLVCIFHCVNNFESFVEYIRIDLIYTVLEHFSSVFIEISWFHNLFMVIPYEAKWPQWEPHSVPADATSLFTVREEQWDLLAHYCTFCKWSILYTLTLFLTKDKFASFLQTRENSRNLMELICLKKNRNVTLDALLCVILNWVPFTCMWEFVATVI